MTPSTCEEYFTIQNYSSRFACTY